MGLDVSWKELITAKKSNKYEKLAWIDAKDMPFSDNYFATVLSVSVMEHINGVGEVLKEAYRVLKPGHRFVFTVNTDKINKYLFWPEFFKKIGLPKVSNVYVRTYHRVFHHVTLWSKDRWIKELKKAGFKIEVMSEIISPRATKMFDFYILTAWPYQLNKILFGKRWSWRPKWFKDYFAEKYSSLVAENDTEGSNLFVVAVKPLDS